MAKKLSEVHNMLNKNSSKTYCFVIKSFILLLLSIVLVNIITARSTLEQTCVSRIFCKTPVSTTASPLSEIPIIFPELEYKELFDIDLSNDAISTVLDHIHKLEAAIASDSYTEEAVLTMQQELARLQDIVVALETDIEHYTHFEQEHYYAAKTWEYFKQQGYNDAVTCGIIGNMMLETSDGTLEISPTIYSPGGSFYGLCQWALVYSPAVAGLSFEEQLDYLIEDMPSNFATFGFCYADGFTFEDFLALEDPGAAAIAFAKVYERCHAGTYNLRANAANIAYNYFVESID